MQTITIINPQGCPIEIEREVAEFFFLDEGIEIKDEQFYLEILFLNIIVTKMSMKNFLELKEMVMENSE